MGDSSPVTYSFTLSDTPISVIGEDNDCWNDSLYKAIPTPIATHLSPIHSSWEDASCFDFPADTIVPETPLHAVVDETPLHSVFDETTLNSVIDETTLHSVVPETELQDDIPRKNYTEDEICILRFLAILCPSVATLL